LDLPTAPPTSYSIRRAPSSLAAHPGVVFCFPLASEKQGTVPHFVLRQHWNYDFFGRWSSSDQQVGNQTYRVTQTYHPTSTLKNETLFSQGSSTRLRTSRSYDLLSRLSSQTHTATGLSGSTAGHQYGYNLANQRTQRTDGNGSTWSWSYDALGQLDTAVRKNSNAQFLAGQQFDFDYDQIGNRTATKRGGDTSGGNLRTMSTTANTLNQYTSVTTPSFYDVLGHAATSTAVTVNGSPTTRQGPYFYAELAAANAGGPAGLSALIQATQGSTTAQETRTALIPPASASPTYDLDGNMLTDGLWSYSWDAENRLLSMEALTTWPAGVRRLKIEHDYDGQSRRFAKRVYGWVQRTITGTEKSVTGSQWALIHETCFLYHGWNLIGEYQGDQTLLRSYLWGTDLSGTAQGAGGVGGLLALTQHQASAPAANQVGTYFVTDDGQGNITSLIRATDGTTAATYEYGPFGEPLRASGPMAAANPIRYSTKYIDNETGLAYYGYRFYDPRMGRWLNRDPIEESGGVNIYGMVGNDPVNKTDYLGMWSLRGKGGAHEDMTTEAWRASSCYKCLPHPESFLDDLIEGVKIPDLPNGLIGAIGIKLPFLPVGAETYASHFGSNQFWHSMRSTETNAQQLRDKIVHHIHTLLLSFQIQIKDGDAVGAAKSLGFALHTLQDSYSKSHVSRIGGGVITLFQDYSSQDSAKHEVADQDEGSLEYIYALQSSKSLIDRVVCGKKGGMGGVLQFLSQEVFPLAPRASAGGSDPVYLPTPPPVIPIVRMPLGN
jgi:RHS repeat-associated protein